MLDSGVPSQWCVAVAAANVGTPFTITTGGFFVSYQLALENAIGIPIVVMDPRLSSFKMFSS